MKNSKIAPEKRITNLSAEEKALLRYSMYANALGRKYLKKYGICSRCTFSAIMETVGLQSDDISRAATGFFGGIGDLGVNSCGAFTAGVMALSYKFGHERYNWYGDFGLLKALIKKLYNRFIDEYGSNVCRDIQRKVLGRSYDLWDSKDMELFHNASPSLYECSKIVGNAAGWTVQLILEGENEVHKIKMTERFRRKGWEFLQFLKDLLLLK
jgi:C_GCAxxG_C_C family probable redox protein